MFGNTLLVMLTASILILPFVFIASSTRNTLIMLGVMLVLALANGSMAGTALIGVALFAPLEIIAIGVVLVVQHTRATRKTVKAAPRAASHIPSQTGTTKDQEPTPLITEDVTVVLRRQVPIRFDDPARSWIGGLPVMPDDLAWPTATSTRHPERGDVPLHFVAQICCDDLPPQLWGGLGPRAGWLLVFHDAHSEQGPNDNSKSLCVVHTLEHGQERHPPEGIWPHVDAADATANADYFVRPEDVPPVWRRWPVDLIALPNAQWHDKWRDSDDPAPTRAVNTIDMLYGASDTPPRAIPDRLNGHDAPENWPYTWRGALFVVNSLIPLVGKSFLRPVRPADLKLFDDPSWAQSRLEHARRAVIDYETRLTGLQAPRHHGLTASERARIEQSRQSFATHLLRERTTVDLLERHAGSDGLMALRDELIASRAAFDIWWRGREPILRDLRRKILDHDLNAPISEDDFRPIHDALAGE
ncbi:MAG: DUF1963 domain-containing protein, partial [Deltaproteobacteria bacterium]